MPEVVIDPRVWHQLYKDLGEFEPALRVSMRRRLKELGERAADAVRDELKAASGALGADDLDAIEAGVSAKVSFTKRDAGVKIVASASKLPAPDKGLVKALELKTFRHPIFGRKDGGYLSWPEQAGHPYFGAAIGKTIDSDLTDEIDGVIEDALRAIGARSI